MFYEIKKIIFLSFYSIMKFSLVKQKYIAVATIDAALSCWSRQEHSGVDTKLLDAGDHNGSTFYQHERFAKVLRGEQNVEVTLNDGIKAVIVGLAAQKSIETGIAIDLVNGDYKIF